MPEFIYEALDKSGTTTTGSITAHDTSEAAMKVRALGVHPYRIAGTGRAEAEAPKRNGAAAANGRAHAASANQNGNVAAKKVARIQILLFTREMADLLDAGLPMDRAFSVLGDQTENELLRSMLTTMQGDIRAGQPLSEALTKYPREFPALYSNMVRAGEVSGQLPSVMTRLADFLEKESIRRSQIVAALTYPAVLIGVALFAITFLLLFVMPRLAGIFHDMGSALPLPTVILLGASGFIGHYWWLIGGGIAGAIYGFRTWVNTEAGRYTFDRFQLRAPGLGPLTVKVVSARLVRTLGTLLGGGVPILESLDIAATAVGNVVTTEAITAVRGGVRQGETVHEAMDRVGGFLPVVCHMTAVGEETGRLPNMLLRTADTLDFEVDNAMRRLTSLVEPLVVLFMGGFVGFVVLSILLPIFGANNLVK